jgi:SAM-dependent methyltransferase
MKHRAWLLPSFVVLLVAVLIILIAGSTSAAPPIAQADRPKLDVPFVPTPRPVVDKMLELADPTADDYLIDLGSGDGRIPITAAQRFGTRGLGIDIDPRRIAEARKNAEEAGVSDKVEFRQEDLFQTDISQATILTLYLLPSVNIKLRPRILKELRPGTRVVSHDWDMGDWRPDQTVELGNKTVFMWVVPASAEGRWQVSDSETGRSFALRLKQRYQDVEGEADIDGQQVPLRNPRIEGDRIFFELPSENGDIKHYEGRIAEQVIEGEGWQAKPLT